MPTPHQYRAGALYSQSLPGIVPVVQPSAVAFPASPLRRPVALALAAIRGTSSSSLQGTSVRCGSFAAAGAGASLAPAQAASETFSLLTPAGLPSPSHESFTPLPAVPPLELLPRFPRLHLSMLALPERAEVHHAPRRSSSLPVLERSSPRRLRPLREPPWRPIDAWTRGGGPPPSLAPLLLGGSPPSVAQFFPASAPISKRQLVGFRSSAGGGFRLGAAATTAPPGALPPSKEQDRTRADAGMIVSGTTGCAAGGAAAPAAVVAAAAAADLLRTRGRTEVAAAAAAGCITILS